MERHLFNMKPLHILIAIAIALALLHGCKVGYAQELTASYYSEASLKKEGTWKTSKGVMANGKIYDENRNTCATRLYPLGTILKISSSTGFVICEVTDRIGKRFAKTRIDLSKKAFGILAPHKQGLIQVEVEEL